MRRGQSRAADAAQGFLGRIDRNGAMARAEAVRAWRAAAGTEVAAHAMGFAMRDQELLVFVDSAVWAAELSALSEHYRAAVNERVGKELVGDVRFAVSNRVSKEREHRQTERESAEEIRPALVSPAPVSEIERSQIEQMAACIKSKKVREAVVRAAIADLEWKKGRLAANSPHARSEGPTQPKSGPEH